MRAIRPSLRGPSVAWLVSLLALVCLLPGCAAGVPNRDPVGEVLPSVEGQSLAGESLRLPEGLAGEPAILLLGYVQDAQFDADRWLYGLLQARPPARILEVPTVRGLGAELLSGTIDSGMRSGIPEEDWAGVVTVYGGDAKDLVEFTGSENGRNMRVLLLDREGRVRWFHDRGFSAGKLIELERALAELL